VFSKAEESWIILKRGDLNVSVVVSVKNIVIMFASKY
jgi:hypothetical protein